MVRLEGDIIGSQMNFDKSDQVVKDTAKNAFRCQSAKSRCERFVATAKGLRNINVQAYY